MEGNNPERAALIAELNDRLRRTGEGGMIVLTRGIQGLGEGKIAEIMIGVQEFSQFTPDNDPHNEHDFGVVQIEYVVFWKIDYYDPSLTYGSEDPADETKTRRVLTIMLSDEY